MEHVLVADLVKEVRVTLDENRVETEYIQSDTDNMDLDEIIRSKIVDAVRAVSMSAPLHLLDAEPMIIPDAAQYSQTDGSGYVVLPPDFFRLILFKMRSWRVPVYVAVDDTSDVANQQKSLFTRGTPLRPICVLSRDIAGNRTLEYYSVGYTNNGEYNRRDHRLERALYLRYPEIVVENEEEHIDFGKKLREAIINYCAALTLVSRGNAQAAESFFNLSKSYLE